MDKQFLNGARWTIGLWFLLGLLISPTPGRAGGKDLVDAKELPPVTLAEPWEFKLAVPGWLAGVSGETGLKGHDNQVDVGFDSILRKLNFTASFIVEARRGPFGAYADFLYLSDQDGVFTNGLVSKLDLRADEYQTNFDLEWRVLQCPRGWVDVLAGFRYTNLYDRLGLQTDSEAIEAASIELVEAHRDQLRELLEKNLRGVLDLKNPGLPLPPLAADQTQKLIDLIQRAREDPELAAALASGSQARIDRAKNRVAAKIAQGLEKNLNRNFPFARDWFDPYLGFRARYNLSKAFYLTVKADIGGFGVGSKITWQAYGAVGCQLTRAIYSEAGYRYLYVDYDKSDFLYKTSVSGAEITLGLLF